MRTLVPAVLLALAALSSAAQADEATAPFKAEEHYVVLPTAIPVAVPGKIEVVELFWYGCPHCYQFEPKLNPWIKSLPADVNFRRIPALFGGLWNAHGQLFLTLEAMGVEPKVHEAIFEAIHKQGLKLATPAEMGDFLAKEGIDREAFLKTFDSFAVKGNMEKARQLAMAYKVKGVPALIVNGKYRFDIGSAGGEEQALKLGDYLISQERTAR